MPVAFRLTLTGEPYLKTPLCNRLSQSTPSPTERLDENPLRSPKDSERSTTRRVSKKNGRSSIFLKPQNKRSFTESFSRAEVVERRDAGACFEKARRLPAVPRHSENIFSVSPHACGTGSPVPRRPRLALALGTREVHEVKLAYADVIAAVVALAALHHDAEDRVTPR